MKLKYTGKESTIVYLEFGGARADIKKGDVFETDELVARDLLGAYGDVFEKTEDKVTVNKPRVEEKDKAAGKKVAKENGGGSTANDGDVERISPSTIQNIGKK